MSLIERDITKNSEQLIFILLTKHKSKIIGVYTDLSNALKYLYLSDEAANLCVSKVDVRAQPCINDSFDNYIGYFTFVGENGDLMYTRNLTGECEIVQESQLINKVHYDEITDEINQVAFSDVSLNEYHGRAHEVVDNAITRKFNLLSSWLVTKVNPKINVIIDNEIELDYNLTYESNQYYQKMSDQLDILTIEEKVDALHKINKFIEDAISHNTMCDEIAKQMDIEFEFGQSEGSSTASLDKMEAVCDMFGDIDDFDELLNDYVGPQSYCDTIIDDSDSYAKSPELSTAENESNKKKYKINIKKGKKKKTVTFKNTPEVLCNPGVSV